MPDPDEVGDLPDRSGGRCPYRVGWVMVCWETGETFPARCGRNACAYCLPLNARRRALAVAWSRPARTITITNLAEPEDPEPWQRARRKVNRVRELLKRAGHDPGSWGYFIERGSETGMVHAHVVQRGPRYLPKGAVQSAAHRAGAGWTRIESVVSQVSLSRYVVKGLGLAGYVSKGFLEEGAASAALDLNGGRLGHFSRGYWPEGVRSVREAEKAALRAAQDPDEVKSWVLVREA